MGDNNVGKVITNNASLNNKPVVAPTLVPGSVRSASTIPPTSTQYQPGQNTEDFSRTIYVGNVNSEVRRT